MYEHSSIQHTTIYIYILCGLRKGLLVVVFAWRVLRHIHQYTQIHRHFHWQREEKYRHTHTHSWHIHMSRCILIDYYYVVLYRTSFTSINTSYNIIIWLCILLLYLMKCHCHFSIRLFPHVYTLWMLDTDLFRLWLLSYFNVNQKFQNLSTWSQKKLLYFLFFLFFFIIISEWKKRRNREIIQTCQSKIHNYYDCSSKSNNKETTTTTLSTYQEYIPYM